MTALAADPYAYALAAFNGRSAKSWDTPGELAADLDPRTVQTGALDLIDAELVRLAHLPDGRLIISMAPQEGKSVRVAGDFPTWWLTRHSDARIVVASYGQNLANRNGRAIRRRITEHPRLGLTIAPDNGAVHEWELAGHGGGVLSVGVGGGLTGRPADLLVIDDPIKDRIEADSETYRQNVWDWWTDVASSRLAPGAPVVLILTRWHQDDLAGRLLAAEDGASWRVLNIPAQADHDPSKDETDPLGRDPGGFMESARRRTPAQWAQRKVTAGTRTWNALYQGRPAPPEGALFKRNGWARYDTPLAIRRDDGSYWVPLTPGEDAELVQSWDMAFKDLDSSDYVVGQVWLRRGVQAFLLDQVRDRMSFTATLQAVKTMTARWPQAVAKYVEDKANGTAVINMLTRSVPGMIPVEPDGSKTARAAAISPFVEAGNVFLPDSHLAPWADELVEEAASFPQGKNDDQVDSLTQAINRLLLNPLLLEQEVIEDELFDHNMIAPY